MSISVLRKTMERELFFVFKHGTAVFKDVACKLDNMSRDCRGARKDSMCRNDSMRRKEDGEIQEVMINVHCI